MHACVVSLEVPNIALSTLAANLAHFNAWSVKAILELATGVSGWAVFGTGGSTVTEHFAFATLGHCWGV